MDVLLSVDAKGSEEWNSSKHIFRNLKGTHANISCCFSLISSACSLMMSMVLIRNAFFFRRKSVMSYILGQAVWSCSMSGPRMLWKGHCPIFKCTGSRPYFRSVFSYLIGYGTKLGFCQSGSFFMWTKNSTAQGGPWQPTFKSWVVGIGHPHAPWISLDRLQ